MRMAMPMAVISSTPILSPLQRVIFSITQRYCIREIIFAIPSFGSRVCLRQRLLFFPVKSAESKADGLHHFRVVPSATLAAVKNKARVPMSVLAAEKEAVEHILTLFLRKQGFTKAAATRTIFKSECFIDHLVSKLHTIDKTRYLVGSELPILALEIKNVLVPYLESLLEEYEYILVDVIENFPKLAPGKEQPTLNMELHSDTRYLIDDIGIGRGQIKQLIRKNSNFLVYNLLGKIKPLVEFLFHLEVSRSSIFTILSKVTYLSEDIIPTFLYMESLGLYKKQWGEVILNRPGVLKYSCAKVKTVTEFFLARGFSIDDVAVMASRTDRLFNKSLKTLTSKYDFFLTLDNSRSDLVGFPDYFSFSLEKRIKPRYAQLRGIGIGGISLFTVLNLDDSEFNRRFNFERENSTTCT